MQFLPLPLSVTPSAGAASQSLAQLQHPENYAETGAGQDGLFALILSQLNVEQPVQTFAGTGHGPITTDLSVQLAATQLPQDGKSLPLLPVNGDLAPAAGVELARPAGVSGDAPLPLPVLPQSLKQPEAPRPALAAPARLSLSQSLTSPVAEPLTTQTDAARAEPANTASTPLPTLQRPELPAIQALVADLPETTQLPQQTSTTPGTAIAFSPSLNPAQGATAPAASATMQHAYTLDQPVADPQWGNELGKRLLWMNENGIGRAQLRMNPPELGPVEVRISVSNDDARVAFQVQHGATREALEQAMPRLREMFASQGLSLDDASVSEQSAQNHGQTGQSGDNSDNENGNDAFEQLAMEMSEAPDDVVAGSLDNGLIDAYA